ncbi:MAG TPA: hypothetical protein VF516_29950 [Kofleriaceae bacterium]
MFASEGGERSATGGGLPAGAPHIDRRFTRLFRTVPGDWRGRPSGQVLPESERDQPGDIADAGHAAAALPL